MPMQFEVQSGLLMNEVNTLEKRYPAMVRPQHDDTHSEELGYVAVNMQGLCIRYSLAEVIIHASKLGGRLRFAQEGEVK